MAFKNVEFRLNSLPAFWSTDKISWSDRTFDLNSGLLGSGGPSANGFIDNLQRDLKLSCFFINIFMCSWMYLKTKKASFCKDAKFVFSRVARNTVSSIIYFATELELSAASTVSSNSFSSSWRKSLSGLFPAKF